MRAIFFLFLFLIFAKSEARPLSVVVVGGGPSGLATAIEAWESGADVTIIEKRTSYLRERAIFLRPFSLKLLEKWHVIVPEMRIMPVAQGKVGLVLINELEGGLAKRVRELEIKIVEGEFKDFGDDQKVAIVHAKNGEVSTIPYDILVGADGVHSHVREKLGIQCRFMASATAAFAQTSSEKAIRFSLSTSKQKGLFVRKFTIPPHHSVILAQSTTDGEIITQEQLGRAAWRAGWYHEADRLIKGEIVFFVNGIEVVLQQATTFSDEEKGALIVGDASCVASFFQSMGANVAFKTASIAGRFFRQFQSDSPDAYFVFNQEMDLVSDELILDSRYLFDL